MESPNPKRLTLQAYISEQVASGKLSETMLNNARVDVLRDPEWAAARRVETDQEVNADAVATVEEVEISLLSSGNLMRTELHDARNKSDIDSETQAALREESTPVLK